MNATDATLTIIKAIQNAWMLGGNGQVHYGCHCSDEYLDQLVEAIHLIGRNNKIFRGYVVATDEVEGTNTAMKFWTAHPEWSFTFTCDRGVSNFPKEIPGTPRRSISRMLLDISLGYGDWPLGTKGEWQTKGTP